jgi:hypothetical protein
MLIYSLRMVHEVYTPKSRNVSDSVAEMNEQVAAIVGYLNSPSAPPALRAEGEAVVARLKSEIDDILALIGRNPQLDPRTPALPAQHDLPIAEATAVSHAPAAS